MYCSQKPTIKEWQAMDATIGCFGNSFSGILDNFELDSPLFYAYQGAGLLEVSGGVPGVAACNKYVQKMAALRNGHYLST